jgi:HTH-type transcriptional regulator/antitoxin HigA
MLVRCNMKLKPIHTKKDLAEALARIDELIDAPHGTPEYDELEILSTLVEAYEDKHSPILPPDPVEAIKFRMEQMGLRQSDIARFLGGKNRASEVLSRKRPLSLRMIRNLHRNLNIPSDSLLGLT